MKKVFLSLAVVAFALTSCTTHRATSTTLDVNTCVNSPASADLVVSGTKVTHTLRPAAKIRRGGLANIKSTAVKEVLTANDADVLVQPEYEVVTRRGLMGKKVKSVTVSGYPAKFKNFKAGR